MSIWSRMCPRSGSSPAAPTRTSPGQRAGIHRGQFGGHPTAESAADHRYGAESPDGRATVRPARQDPAGVEPMPALPICRIRAGREAGPGGPRPGGAGKRSNRTSRTSGGARRPAHPHPRRRTRWCIQPVRSGAQWEWAEHRCGLRMSSRSMRYHVSQHSAMLPFGHDPRSWSAEPFWLARPADSRIQVGRSLAFRRP